MIFSGPFVTRDMPYEDVDVWEVVLSFNCYAKNGDTYTIPYGFVTDGASIPRFLWPLIGHPRDNDIGQAACLHDYLYRYGYTTRKRADELLVEGMEALNAHKAKRALVYSALRIFGGVAWKNARKSAP